jgi:hypothetical protein
MDPWPGTDVWQAACRGDLGKVRRLITEYPGLLNEKDFHGRTVSGFTCAAMPYTCVK